MKRKNSRLPAAAIAVLVLGTMLTIITGSLTIGRCRELENVRREASGISTEVQNLEICIDQYHDLETIRSKADGLGMVSPASEQIRTVVLPQAAGAEAQTVSNTENEAVNG